MGFASNDKLDTWSTKIDEEELYETPSPNPDCLELRAHTNESINKLSANLTSTALNFEEKLTLMKDPP